MLALRDTLWVTAEQYEHFSRWVWIGAVEAVGIVLILALTVRWFVRNAK